MVKQFKMNVVDWAAIAVLVVGAINWGLVGIAHFVDASMNTNVVNLLLGSIPELEFAVYLLVGLAGLYGVYFATRIAGVDVSGPEIETPERGAPK
jgi:uncharacterized membrane protein YuzA (DUF378 family)